jgi:hypothetical protein
MITKENYWDTDLNVIESTFLNKDKTVVDLPVSCDNVVIEQGSVLLRNSVNLDEVFSQKTSIWHKITKLFH